MNSIEQATILVKSAIDALEKELSSSPDPKLACVPKVQKEAFKQKLLKIYNILNSGSLPEKSYRNLGLSRAIADSWPFDSKLGKEIMMAESAFVSL